MRNSDLAYIKKYLSDDKLEEGINLLEKGISPQYIVGNVDFFGNLIEVNSNVLIPRFETELLVEKTLGYINRIFNDGNLTSLKILDIGTGSGCIAISLEKGLKCHVTAVDISKDALEVAKKNAIKLMADINFIESDIFSNVDGVFDVIISNPPYIRRDEDIEDIVKNNEPEIALYGDEDGLYFYRKILEQVSSYIENRFLIAFEIGMDQGEAVKKLALKYLSGVKVLIEKDYSLKDRFVFIFKL